MSNETKVPKYVFIVPYRNRVQHRFFFSKYMSFILEDVDDYEIYFSHQCDARPFNRGATKNIGFLAVKDKYPQHYKDINFIFNDVDTIPFNKIFNYETTHGVAKHFYGFKYALGGIVAMKGADFEKVNGFPCCWSWGMEDSVLQKRCLAQNIQIDRSNFYEIGNPQILQLFDGVDRIINKKDPVRMEKDNGADGLLTITKLVYDINEKSANPNDNNFIVHNSRLFFINISTFFTYVNYENDEYYNYDLREPCRKIKNPDKSRQTNQIVGSSDNWSKIPHYPTSMERRKAQAVNLIRMGRTVPQALARQLEIDKRVEIENDSFNKINQPLLHPSGITREQKTIMRQQPMRQQSIGKYNLYK